MATTPLDSSYVPARRNMLVPVSMFIELREMAMAVNPSLASDMIKMSDKRDKYFPCATRHVGQWGKKGRPLTSGVYDTREEFEKAVVELREYGYTPTAIAHKVGVSDMTVRAVLENYIFEDIT